MNWSILFLAGLLEIAWAIGLRHSTGFTRPLPSVLTLLAMGISFYLLGLLPLRCKAPMIDPCLYACTLQSAVCQFRPSLPAVLDFLRPKSLVIEDPCLGAQPIGSELACAA